MSTVSKIEKMIALNHSETVIADLIFAAFEDGELTRIDLREIMIKFAAFHYDSGVEAGVDADNNYLKTLSEEEI